MKNSIILTVFPIAILAFLNTHAQYTLTYMYDAGGNRQVRTTLTYSCKTAGSNDENEDESDGREIRGEAEEDPSPKSKVPSPKENANKDGVNGSEMTVTPNPSGSGRFHIQINPTKYELVRGYEVRIMNVLGQNVFQTEMNLQSEIDLSFHPKGVYFVKVSTNDEVFTGKIMLQ